MEPDTVLTNKPDETELLEAWREFLDALNPYIKIISEICVKNIAKTVMLKISQYVHEENMFTMNDEKIFEHYAGIMGSYAQTAKVCRDTLSHINDVRLKEILNGIYEILVSQLNQYEDHICGIVSSRGRRNPIIAEKELVLKSTYESVLKALRLVLEGTLSESGYFGRNELRMFCFDCAGKTLSDSHIDFFTFVYERIIEKGGLDIYKSYSGAIMECKSAVNNFELRKETGYFYEALKQEKDNLDSIVKIQVSALEDALNSESVCKGDNAESLAVGRITDMLMFMRQLAEKETEELKPIFEEAESSVKTPILMNYDSFLSFVEERGLCAAADRLRNEGLEAGTLSAVERWRDKLDSFVKIFAAFTAERETSPADQLRYKKFLYEMRLKITDKIILSDEMLKGFTELKDFYTDNAERLKESAPDECMKIIDGINESITIKIDAILEDMKSFTNDANKMLNSFEPPEQSEDAAELLKLRLAVWREEALQSRAICADYWNDMPNHIPFIAGRLSEINETEEYAAKLDRRINKETEAVAKLEAAYLKDCLLFEIITFEEILTYSVSKLRESGDAAVMEYVERCDALEASLEKLCKLHNILIIAPKPFDAFNSSEHEVLVAEKNDEYKKGQIIKMMNSGFKYNEAVLVRANVIAAR